MTSLAIAEREVNLLGPAFNNLFTEEPLVPVIRPAEPEIITPSSNIVIQTANNIYHVQTNKIQSVVIVSNGLNNFFTTSTTSTTSTCNRIIYSSGTTMGTTVIYPTGPQIFVNGFTTTNGTCSTFNIYNGTFQIQSGEYKKERSGVKKVVRNSIKRALKMLDNFGMEEDSKIFLNGQEVEISHPDSMFKFVITKRKYNNIISATEFPIRSVPFRLELFTKTGIHVANLCVYAEDTTMLDQLFMIAMYVKTGNEEDLLRKANFFSVSDDLELKEIIVNEIDYLKPKLLR